jgi:hypothetical protein
MLGIVLSCFIFRVFLFPTFFSKILFAISNRKQQADKNDHCTVSLR